MYTLEDLNNATDFLELMKIAKSLKESGLSVEIVNKAVTETRRIIINRTSDFVKIKKVSFNISINDKNYSTIKFDVKNLNKPFIICKDGVITI